jgi:class 3 adenylate cyclase
MRTLRALLTARLRRWFGRFERDVLTRHHSLVRDQLARHREIDTAGNGFLATFDGPARAVRCGRAIVDLVRTLGIRVRAGVHTGECEVIGEKLGGIAVHIGARIGALAAPDEVLVSRTVSDLVAGSGLQFEERGTHSLKGVPGSWQLLAAARTARSVGTAAALLDSWQNGSAEPQLSRPDNCCAAMA